MSASLFDDFTPVTAKQWKQKIQFDLKGADYNDTLVWTSNEGIQVKPFYHSEDLSGTIVIPETKSSQFKVCETIFVDDVTIANKIALKAISSGVECLKFIIPTDKISSKNLLNHIDLEDTTVYFEPLFLNPEFINNTLPNNIRINTDIIGNLAKSGNWFSNLKDDFSKFEDCLKTTGSLAIHADLYQNAGANIIQQLAYALAHLNEYFNHIESSNPEKANSNIHIVLNVAIGSNYFFEIAKLRALRLLFETLQKEYDESYSLSVFASPSKRNKTIYDYNTNLLRSTTECMSAILGGADIINNLPYDCVFKKSNGFSSRIAKNQLLILKHESYFNVVNNPSDGSYYIETLTKELAEKALALFKDIEKNGGFLKQLKEGTIQRKIKESAAKEQAQVDTGSSTILGSNKHTNPNDKMKSDLEIYPFVKTEKRKTLIEPIIEKRLTEILEQERLKKE